MSERDNYTDRQRARDREYGEAWTSLTPQQRAELAKLGISGPELPVYRTAKHDHEAVVERLGSAEERSFDAADPAAPTGDADHALRQILGVLLMRAPCLELECASLAWGISYLGLSMTEIAKRYGVTKQAVSKMVKGFQEEFQLPPTRAQRQLTACQAYAERAIRVHNRPRASH